MVLVHMYVLVHGICFMMGLGHLGFWGFGALRVLYFERGFDIGIFLVVRGEQMFVWCGDWDSRVCVTDRYVR